MFFCDYLAILLGPIIFSFLLIGCSDLFGVFCDTYSKCSPNSLDV